MTKYRKMHSCLVGQLNFFKICAYASIVALPITSFPLLPKMGQFGGETRPLTYIFLSPLLFLPFCHRSLRISPLIAAWLVFLMFSSLNLAVVLAGNGNIATAINAFLSINLGLWLCLWTSKGFWLRVYADRIQKVYLFVALILVIYGYIEILQMMGIDPFFHIVRYVRELLVGQPKVHDRVTWLTNEPSFASFQLCSTFILNELYFAEREKSKIYRFLQVSLLLQIVFTKSLLAYLSIILILAFSISKRTLLTVFAIACSLGCAFSTMGIFHDESTYILRRVTAFLSGEDPSALTRFYLMLSSYLSGIYTHLIGFGLGQYRFHWKAVFEEYGLPYTCTKELLRHWNRGDLVKPYSVGGGIFAGLGIIGLIIFMVFLFQILVNVRKVKQRKLKRVMFTGWVYAAFILFANAYAPVTPIIWFLLGVIYLKATEQYYDVSTV